MNKFLRNSKGSITVYALVSMAFFLTVSIGIYTNTNNKVQEQDKQIEQIQESYEKEDDINNIYEQTYERIKDITTPTINVYGEENLIATVNGDKVNKIKTIYTHYDNVTLKFSSNLSGYEYGYSTTKDGEKTVGNTTNIKVTEDGTTIYSYLKDVSTGEYFDKYTAIVIKLTSLNDKEIYLAEGTSKEINVTGNKNIGDITYSDISDAAIVSVTENKTLNGLKAGTATIKATESNGGATATITAKVTKIELEKQKGTMLLDDSKIIEVSGINYGALTAELSDSSIATVSIQGSTLNIKANKVGTTTITITESNVGATASYVLNVVSLSLSPNGGNFLLPSDGANATIKTTVIAENEEKVEYSFGTESGQEAWTEIDTGTTLTKSDCIGDEEYYIYIRINEEVIYKSNAFIINGTTNKITIEPDETGWTNQDVTCTITYPEESVNSTRKSAYGSSLQSATTNSNSVTEPTTNVIVSENGYVYAQATDIAGNKVTASLPITNIDKLNPKITVNPTSGTVSKTTNVTITVADEGLSGLNSNNSYQYQLSTSNTTVPTGTWSTYTNGTAVTIGTNLTGTYYLWVKEVTDNAGNISSTNGTKVETYHVFGTYVFDNTVPTCTITASKSSPTNASSITYTFTWSEEVTGFTTDDITVTNGTKGTFSATTANKVFTLVVTNSGTCIQTVSVAASKCTDVAGNNNTAASKTITIDRTAPTVSFSPNGNTYTIVSGNTQTISSKVTVSDTGGTSVNTTKYAWSTSNSTTPTSWTTFTNGGAISKSSVAIGSTYYLWIQATDTVGNTVTTKSSAFTVLEARWQNTTSGTYYNTLSLAVSGSTTGTTIKLLKSYTDTSSVSISKNLTIDINSYTLTKTTSNIAINSGYTVTVSGSGTIEGQVSYLFKNSGTLNFTSSNTLKITNTNSYAVHNAGTLNINNYCNISSSSTTIYQTSGTLNKNGANCAVSSSGGYTLYVTGGTVNLNAGSITATGSYQTIRNSGGTVNVQGATVSKTTAANNAIYNLTSGTLNIKSGTVTSNQTNATITNYATLTMSGGNVINTCSSGGCIALASSQSSTISGGRIYVTKSRSATDTSGQTYNLYQHSGGTMNITGVTIGNEAYNSTTVLGNYGLVIQGGTVNMTGGRINIASNTTYPGRGVSIGGSTSVFNLSATSSSSYAQVTAYSTVASAGAYNIGVELHDSTSTFNLKQYGRLYAVYNNGTSNVGSGYAIYKNAGTYTIGSAYYSGTIGP